MNAIQILEEAVDLLRAAPMRSVVMYLTGAVPFTIALLFFLNDMTRSAFAFEHLVTWSLGLAVLYVWKNVWQALFSADLYGQLSPGSRRPSNPLRLIAMQAALQPLGLTLSLILVVPFPWFVAFFRNAGLFAALGAPDALSRARKQAALWTRQNWGVLGITALGGALLFLNVLVMIVVLPQLARSFLGIEGDLARLGNRMFNLNSTAAAVAIAWLVIDPLLDAVYVLRGYYGESIATGEDLLAALRRATGVLVLLTVACPILSAQVDPAQLDHSIDQVIHSREFTWRTPRAAGPPSDSKWVSWIYAAQNAVRRFFNWLGDVIRHLFDRLRPQDGEGQESGVSRTTMEALIAVAVALVVGAGVFYFLRTRTPVVAANPVTIATAVNLDDESFTADQLPESSWLQLAEEWLAKGDARLALRALYLAGLNYLSGRGLVSITKWKSGLDYRRELERRARATPGIGQEFARINGIFEYGWYGVHGVDRSMVESFASGLNTIRGLSERGA
jgi:hypothetical protein